jgi:hypothetical protein
LAIFHVAIATATKTPELMIGDDEAKSLASATINVLDQYDIRPDPKIEAMVTLIGVAAATYAPRVVAIRMRKAQEAEEKKGKAGVYGPDGFAMGTTDYSNLNANVQ